MKINKHFIYKLQSSLQPIIAAIVFAGIIFIGQGMVYAGSSCSLPATTYGSDSMTLSIPQAGNYTIWTRIKIPSSSANSVLLNINNGSECYDVGGSSTIPTNTWEWVDYYGGSQQSTIALSLSQGSHTFLFTGTSSGVEIDRVEALSQANCTPSGSGDNCLSSTTPTSPPSTNGSGGGSSNNSNTSASGPLTTGGNGSTPAINNTNGQDDITAPITLEATSASPGVTKVEYLLNGKLLATKYTYPYSFKLNSRNLLNGKYTLKTKYFYSSGETSTQSQQIVIKNPESFTQIRLTAQKYAAPIVAVLIFFALLLAIVIRQAMLRKVGPNGQTPENLNGPLNKSVSTSQPEMPNPDNKNESELRR